MHKLAQTALALVAAAIIGPNLPPNSTFPALALAVFVAVFIIDFGQFITTGKGIFNNK